MKELKQEKIKETDILREPITSGSVKQDGNEIEHPTDFVRYKHAFIEEEDRKKPDSEKPDHTLKV